MVHLVDARTFKMGEVIRVPTVSKRSPTPPAPRLQPMQPRPVPSPQQRHFYTSSTNSSRIGSPSSFLVDRPSSPRRSPTITHRDLSIVQALGDAFRIPPSAYSAPPSESDSTWHTVSGLAHRSSGPRGSAGQGDQDPLLIPPLGDRDVKSEVHAMLGGHGLQSATRHPGVVNDDEDTGDGWKQSHLPQASFQRHCFFVTLAHSSVSLAFFPDLRARMHNSMMVTTPQLSTLFNVLAAFIPSHDSNPSLVLYSDNLLSSHCTTSTDYGHFVLCTVADKQRHLILYLRKANFLEETDYRFELGRSK